MITFLRWLGLLNAAIWFGGSVFFTFVAAPAFFSPEMKSLLPDPYGGAAAQIVLVRYFYLHYACGAIAFLHLAAEWLYIGRGPSGKALIALSVIFACSLIGGLWFLPTLKGLHQTKYRAPKKEQRDQAAASFRLLHGVSQGTNLIMVAGLLFYFCRSAGASNGTRFIPTAKFRG